MWFYQRFSKQQIEEILAAIKEGNVPNVEKLLNTYPRLVNAQDKHSFYGHAPLHVAASIGNIEIAELLVAKRSNVNLKNRNGQTALHIAAFEGNINVAELLISNKADVNSKDVFHVAPLYVAAANNQSAIVRLLLEHKARINAKAMFGRTALQIAAFYCNMEIVRLLLSSGADVNAKDKWGGTALHLVSVSKDKYGATVEEWENAASDFDVASLLISAGADVCALDKDGWTPFQWAAAEGNFGVAQSMSGRGACIPSNWEKHWMPGGLRSEYQVSTGLRKARGMIYK